MHYFRTLLQVFLSFFQENVQVIWPFSRPTEGLQEHFIASNFAWFWCSCAAWPPSPPSSWPAPAPWWPVWGASQPWPRPPSRTGSSHWTWSPWQTSGPPPIDVIGGGQPAWVMVYQSDMVLLVLWPMHCNGKSRTIIVCILRSQDWRADSASDLSVHTVLQIKSGHLCRSKRPAPVMLHNFLNMFLGLPMI